VAVGIP
jgi:hypothetical protein